MKLRGVAEAVRAALSPPSRGAWIEIAYWEQTQCGDRSPPSRGAWIEIPSGII